MIMNTVQFDDDKNNILNNKECLTTGETKGRFTCMYNWWSGT